MKPSIAILYVLVSLCLAISLAALLIVANNHGVFTPINPIDSPTASATLSPATNSPTPSFTYGPTLKPTLTPTPSPDQLTISYTETSRKAINNDLTQVTLTVDVTYHSDSTISLSYSDFYLQLATLRFIYVLGQGTATPENSGTITLGSSPFVG